jgi:7-cyano-7-deazaguanine reductase
MAPKHKPKEQFQAHGRTLPFKGEEAIDTAVLECFDYEYAGKRGDIEIVTTTNEFTSVCPFSGLPDFAEIVLTYTPHRKCIELRSLKYYLMSFREVGIWYEHLVKRMLDDLVRVVQPKKMSLEIRANARGGLASTVRAEYARH